MGQLKEKPKPFLFEEYCKGCGRCITACPQHCIAFGSEINAQTGVIPVTLDLEECNACGLCISSCPEPYGLQPQNENAFELHDPKTLFGRKPTTAKIPQDLPDVFFELGETEPLVIKGTYASAIGAILAGCRHFFGYPITPSTEGAELMAKLLPMLDGVFIQAVSEVATVNFMYGCGGAGLPCMTFTSSPGFSLMLEGISYLIGAEVPAVFANVMRGGPGLGNIAPEQADIKLACRGLGHGNTQAIVLAPASPQEMLDLTILAFELAFNYRNPTIILSDGYLGQMTGKVTLPKTMKKVGIPSWAVYGDEEHRKNLICSIMLEENDLEKHNIHLNQKYQKITENEQRSNTFYCEDAEILLVASNTPSKMAKGAVEELRQKGIKIGLFRPITLYPFPINDFKPLVEKAKRLIVVEASNGQLEDEVRLALSHANVKDFPHIEHVRRFGGILPQQHEIIEQVLGK
ncbi:3-methyl-2-oxobutanoate dehydrogenase subunit VorB [bacterium]|nr:3-methyl-2-oxobutanoate dehydrogenase subunit VorB [bacterium]